MALEIKTVMSPDPRVVAAQRAVADAQFDLTRSQRDSAEAAQAVADAQRATVEAAQAARRVMEQVAAEQNRWPRRLGRALRRWFGVRSA